MGNGVYMYSPYKVKVKVKVKNTLLSCISYKIYKYKYNKANENCKIIYMHQFTLHYTLLQTAICNSIYILQ